MPKSLQRSTATMVVSIVLTFCTVVPCIVLVANWLRSPSCEQLCSAAFPASSPLQPQTTTPTTKKTTYSLGDGMVVIDDDQDLDNTIEQTEKTPWTTGMDQIQAVFVINREPRRDRRLRTEFLLRVIGVKRVHFIRAIESSTLQLFHLNNTAWTASSLDLKLTKNKIDSKPAEASSWGAVACRQSHVKVLKRIQQLDLTALVLEDDVDFEIDFVAKLAEVMKNLPKDWSLLRIGGCWDPLWQSVAPLLWKTGSHTCSHSLIVNGAKAAKLMLGTLDTPDGTMPVDVQLDLLLRTQNQYHAYTTQPWLTIQVDNKGDIPSSGGRPSQQLVQPTRNKVKELAEGWFKKRSPDDNDW